MSRIRLVVATRNANKLKEIRAVLGDLPYEIVGAAEIEGCPDVVEDGATLEANAEKKARAVCAFTHALTLADDTGLEVDVLDGAPGVYSARYAGEDATYADNCKKLVRALEGVPEERRTAHFRSIIAIAEPALEAGHSEGGQTPAADHPGRLELFEGRIEGRITTTPRGSNGFGYDPVFYFPPERCTLAEMSLEQKNHFSHRGRALAAAHQALARRAARSGAS